jgi:hypothetical protein
MTEGQAITKAIQEWFSTDQGSACIVGPTDNPYLRNRIEAAFIAGWEAGKQHAENEMLSAAGEPKWATYWRESDMPVEIRAPCGHRYGISEVDSILKHTCPFCAAQEIAVLRALKDEPEGWVSEERIAIAAKVIADSPLIDAPKLPAECWHGLARAVLAAKPSRGWLWNSGENSNSGLIIL